MKTVLSAENKHLIKAIKEFAAVIINKAADVWSATNNTTIAISPFEYKSHLVNIANTYGAETPEDFVEKYADEFKLFGITCLPGGNIYYGDKAIPRYHTQSTMQGIKHI